MADSAQFQFDGLVKKAHHRGHADSYRRRNLRIAIRQLERAELYLVALYSLDLEDKGAEAIVGELVQGIRGLQRHLLSAKLTI
jgi:hypothetical protein